MRNELKKIADQRDSFKGMFKKYGLKSGYKGHSAETVLLVDICNSDGVLICDHLWLNLTKGFENLGSLTEGDIIQFEARVKRYTKGYVNRRGGIDQRKADYKLSHPTKISRVK